MLIAADASQIEWRTILFLAQDKVGIQEIVDKLDAHSLNQKAFDLPSRLIAKIYLFSTIYRAKGWSFAHNPDFMHVSTDPKYWDDVGEKFYKKYHVIDKTHHMWADMVVRGQPMISPFGREWLIEMKRSKRGELEIPWTVLTNYIVQGTAADIMMLARVSFARRLKASGLSAILISTVHDSVICDVKYEKDYQAVINLYHQVFDDLIPNMKRLFGIDWNVPLDCEVKMGLDMKNQDKVVRTDK